MNLRSLWNGWKFKRLVQGGKYVNPYETIAIVRASALAGILSVDEENENVFITPHGVRFSLFPMPDRVSICIAIQFSFENYARIDIIEKLLAIMHVRNIIPEIPYNDKLKGGTIGALKFCVVFDLKHFKNPYDVVAVCIDLAHGLQLIANILVDDDIDIKEAQKLARDL